MRNNVANLCLIILLFISTSFNSKMSLEEQLMGFWVRDYHNYESGYIRSSKQQMDEFNKGNNKGESIIHFQENGKLTAILPFMGCGTPPFPYEYFKGSWKIVEDSVIKIRHDYYGKLKRIGFTKKRNVKYSLSVNSVDNGELVLSSMNK